MPDSKECGVCEAPLLGNRIRFFLKNVKEFFYINKTNTYDTIKGSCVVMKNWIEKLLTFWEEVI